MKVHMYFNNWNEEQMTVVPNYECICWQNIILVHYCLHVHKHTPIARERRTLTYAFWSTEHRYHIIHFSHTLMGCTSNPLVQSDHFSLTVYNIDRYRKAVFLYLNTIMLSISLLTSPQAVSLWVISTCFGPRIVPLSNQAFKNRCFAKTVPNGKTVLKQKISL